LAQAVMAYVMAQVAPDFLNLAVPMTQTSDPLAHRFVVADSSCTLTVDLPSTLSSLNDVELDVGCDAVRVRLPGACAASVIDWPSEVQGRLDFEKSSAKFSRKHAHLIVKLPLSELTEVDVCSGGLAADAPVSRIAPEHAVERSPTVCTTPTSGSAGKQQTLEEKLQQQYAQKLKESAAGRQQEEAARVKVSEEAAKAKQAAREKEAARVAAAKLVSTSGQQSTGEDEQQLHERDVQGSGWNVGSFHWEERPMIKWSQAWFNEKLPSVSWPLCEGRVNFEFSETKYDILKDGGDISLCVRKGKPIVLYELDACIRWGVLPVDGTPEFQCRGTFWIRNFTSEDGAEAGPEAAEIECAVGIDTSKGRYVSKAVKDDGVRRMRLMLKQFLDELVSQAMPARAKA